MFDPSGVPLTAEIKIDAPPTIDFNVPISNPSVEALPGGGFTIGAYDQTTYHSGAIYRQYIVDADYTTVQIVNQPQGANFQGYAGDVGILIGGAPIVARYGPAAGGITVNGALVSANEYPDFHSMTITGFGDGWLMAYSRAGDVRVVISTPTVQQSYVVNTNASGSQVMGGGPLNTVAALTNGNFVIAWTDNDPGTGVSPEDGSGVRARIIGPDGLPIGGEIVLNQTTEGSQGNVEIAALSGGGFVALYKLTNGQIVLRVFDNQGAAVTSEFEVQGYVPYGTAIGIAAVTDHSVAVTIIGAEGNFFRLIDLRDFLDGTPNADTLTGGGWMDVIDGKEGNDTLNGGGGDDTLIGGPGDDVMNGGDGADTADYSGATGNVTVNLTLSGVQRTGGGGRDTLTSIENLIGSAFSDRLTGDAGANTITDTLGGGDRLVGGVGDDVLTIERSGAGAATISSMNGGADRDRLTFDGHDRYTDRITIDGSTGSDVIVVRGAGQSIIDAGSFNDMVSVDVAAGDHNVTLGLGSDTLALTRAAGFGAIGGTVVVQDFTTGLNGDVLDLHPLLESGALSGYFLGNNPFVTGHLRLLQVGTVTRLQVNADGLGSDWVTLVGLRNTTAGAFTAANFAGFHPRAAIAGDDTDNNLIGTTAADLIEGRGGADNLFGGEGDDTLMGGLGDDVLVPGPGTGADILNGGDGNDTVAYADATAGVSVGLGLDEYQNTGGAGMDWLISVENLLGSAFNDQFIGDGQDNLLSDTRGGSDTLYGEGGADQIRVRRDGAMAASNVWLEGGSGDDVVAFTRVGARVDGVVAVGGSGEDDILVTGALTATITAGDDDDLVQIDTMGGSYNVFLGAGQDILSITHDGAGGIGGGITVQDFVAGDGGDALDIDSFIESGLLQGYAYGTNPFTSGYLRIIQAGPNVRLQVNIDGQGNDWQTILGLKNVTVGSLTPFNLDGYSLTAPTPAEAGKDDGARTLPGLDQGGLGGFSAMEGRYALWIDGPFGFDRLARFDHDGVPVHHDWM